MSPKGHFRGIALAPHLIVWLELPNPSSDSEQLPNAAGEWALCKTCIPLPFHGFFGATFQWLNLAHS